MTDDSDGSTAIAHPKSSNEESLAMDRVFDALAHQRRRHVLHCLRNYDQTMALADLADEVSVRENETAITEISAEEVKRVYISLYHTHIPKLQDVGVVEYSQERDTVTLLDTADQLDEYLA